MNIQLLAVALSIASLTACESKDFNVVDALVGQSTGHQQNFVDTTEDEPSIPPKAAEPSVYVPPLGEPCNPGDYQFRVWSCVDGHRFYI